ncbi:MAG: phosphatidylglycerophosphatase A [Alphaproteobacteria bacterium]|nr:phosphatidylglycerophosphatase A [Alphaproteobacteria bacterium]
MIKKISLIIATFFGAGLAKKAPGTMGSLATLPLAFVLAYYFGFNGIVYAAFITFAIGVPAVYFATKGEKNKDPGKIVIDETAGQLICFILVAQNLYQQATLKTLVVYLLGFALFRAFDIVKIGPVKWADTKIKNAFGVMLDDVFAGLFAAIVLVLLYKTSIFNF